MVKRGRVDEAQIVRPTANLLESLVDEVSGMRLRAALFSTYTFGATFFQRGPLQTFTREGADIGLVPITVIADRKQFRGAGRGYEVVLAPVNLWHPKLVLMMVEEPGTGNRRTVMAVGSGNLTQAGWERNREFFLVEAWPGWGVPSALQEWLDAPWLKESAFARWNYRDGGGRRNGDRRSTLLSGMHQSIWSQLELCCGTGRWSEAHVLAPFTDQSSDPDAEPGGLGRGFFTALLDKSSPEATLHVYLRGTSPDAEQAVGSKQVFEALEKRLGASRFKVHVVRPECERYLHAKLFAWKVGGIWTVVAGSPNATSAAMVQGPEHGNVELAWELRRVGKSLPKGLFPKCKALRVSDVTFTDPAFDLRPCWEALESATANPATGKVAVKWLSDADRKGTEIRLAGRAVVPGSISFTGTDERALEVRPRSVSKREEYRSSWVPISFPAGEFDDAGTLNETLTPEEWLAQLGEPAPPESSGDGQDEPPARSRTKARKRAAGGRVEWDVNVRARRLESQLDALWEAILGADSPEAMSRLMRVVRGVWKAHDPATSEPAQERAWRNWVRAGIVGILLDFDGRRSLSKPLVALGKRWRNQVRPELLGGRNG